MSIKMSNFIPSFIEEIDDKIIDIDDLTKIFKRIKCGHDTHFIFDIDNTLIIPAGSDVGSDQWFDAFLLYAINIIGDKVLAKELTITLFVAIQALISVKPVQCEMEIHKFLKVLQDINLPILALTSRGTNVTESTVIQLKNVGIDFSKQWPQEEMNLILKSGHVVGYVNGIIYCEGKDKGSCLDAFFTQKKISPKHIIVFDDKKENLKSVQKIAEERKIKFNGVRCSHEDNNISSFNLDKTFVSLSEMSTLFNTQALKALSDLKLSKSLEVNCEPKESQLKP